jgi:putative flavoprotein involved in K+ transport
MIHPDGYWRDLLTFGWNFRTLHGQNAILSWLVERFESKPAQRFQLEGEPFVAAIGERGPTLEFFFRFETPISLGRGYVRLLEEKGRPAFLKAFTLLTTMQALKDFPEPIGRNRPHEDMRVTSRRLEAWPEGKNAEREFRDRDPEVLIVGGGQSGLMMAARLRQLNVPTLVVERTASIGDVWRHRYRSLKLHNDLCMNHFPYMPFPETWPVYLPKDKVAQWLEFYAEAMELNVWTSTTFLSGAFDIADKKWTVRLRFGDGTTRTIRPSHLIMALGVSGQASVPKLDGMDEFGGIIMHSSGPTDDLDVQGKRVVVVGAGTSAHDLAQNFCLRGAAVTMVQRSPVTVVNLKPSAVRAYQMYRDNEGVRSIADTDMMAAAVPYPLLIQIHRKLSREMADTDKDLLDGLRKVGFLLDNGEDDAGYFIRLLQQQAGYYLNIGASDLIIEGRIKLKAGVGINRLAPNQAIFTDGSALPADIIVLATGYEPLQEAVRKMLGDEIADRVGPIWGIGQDSELRNMYAPTAQEGFYVVGGGFPAARAYSLYTALYIKASLEGLLQSSSAPQLADNVPDWRGEPLRQAAS